MQTYPSIYDFEVTTLAGQLISLAAYRNQVILIVNVASLCLFTPQYASLEQLYQKYRQQGLVILGFPCNQFLAQEPHSNTTIKTFCATHYQISFPLFDKIKVNGRQAHPLYIFLKKHKPGILRLKFISWNFTKFLVARNGKVYRRFSPHIAPAKLEKDIELLLSL